MALKKTSIYLDDDLDQRLARRAAEEGVTKAEFIRRTLAGAAMRPRRPKPVGIGVITGRSTKESATSTAHATRHERRS